MTCVYQVFPPVVKLMSVSNVTAIQKSENTNILRFITRPPSRWNSRHLGVFRNSSQLEGWAGWAVVVVERDMVVIM